MENSAAQNVFQSEDELLQMAERVIKSGAFTDNPLFEQFRELAGSFHNLLNLTKQLVKLGDGHQESLHQLNYFATLDGLTGVANKRAGLEMLEGQLQQTTGYQGNFSVCMLKVNDVRFVNEHFGFQEGDQLLVAICQFIRQAIRPRDLLCRMGGDEFMIIFPKCVESSARMVIGRIVELMEEKNAFAGKPYRYSFGYGILEVGDCSVTSDELIAKASGRMIASTQKVLANVVNE
ncbi:MAG TPA: GGDEF domain-containing protein [Bacillota bacterium]|nr:GGDEF domain-containing protein [Bacillota bacterium]